MSEFIAYPSEALNETYLNSSHAHVSDRRRFHLPYCFPSAEYLRRVASEQRDPSLGQRSAKEYRLVSQTSG